MDVKEKGSDSIQQYTEDGRGLLVREHYSEELRNFLVAVYGTLKRGYSNHTLLHGADFIADKPGVGKNVKVEVYLVDKDTLEALDMLEGHPDWYERKQKNVLCTGLSRDGFDYHNAILSPWIYMAPEHYYTEAEVLYETY